MWKIALYGTNVLYKPDADSTIDLSAIDGAVDPMTDNRWLKVDVIAVNPHWDTYGDLETGNGGVAIHPRAQVRTLKIETTPYAFPDDMHKIEALASVLNKRRVFLFKGEYPETVNWSLHPAGKALCVALKISTEDIHEDGTKELILDGRAMRVRR